MQLPRFQLDSSYMLRDTLQNLEITKVFESGAEINVLGVGGAKLDQVTSRQEKRLCLILPLNLDL